MFEPLCLPHESRTSPRLTVDAEIWINHSMGSFAHPYPATDPAVYGEHHRNFASSPLPVTAEDWIQRAVKVALVLTEDAAAREKENKSPVAEIALLKSAGLTRVLGPKKYGGGGQGWDVAYWIIREIAKGDGSIGMLLGYHLLWSWTSAVVGTDEQNERTQKLIIENNYFVGGAVNPRDDDQKISDAGDHVIFNGFKHFNTGGVVSDLTVLEGVSHSELLTKQRLYRIRCTKGPTNTSLLSRRQSKTASSSRTTGTI